MKNIILIPAHNPPREFINLINSILNICSLNIIVIDDGSNPAINIINNSRIIHLRNKTNRGKGYSLLKGFNFCKEHNYQFCLTIDADFQHDPNYIKNFINTDKSFSLVLGKRNFSDKMPIHRKFSNTITSYIISLLTKSLINDSQCGFRRYEV